MSSHHTSRVPFLKGHGAGNDFVVVNDLDGKYDFTADQVARICDRHRGIGADGVLRVIRKDDRFFMDYRNADGSIAETCGNGLRVFARYLVEHNLESRGSFDIGSRAGVVRVTIDENDTDFNNIAVEIGRATWPTTTEAPRVTTPQGQWDATAVFVPNPHCVAVVSDITAVGDLHTKPVVEPQSIFPHDANFEFIEQRGTHHIGMRTYERGVGETLACGSGSCAAADVWAKRNNLGDTWTIQVDLLGGTVFVDSRDGVLTLRGPARIVATGELSVDF